jgi:hypothetical protein
MPASVVELFRISGLGLFFIYIFYLYMQHWTDMSSLLHDVLNLFRHFGSFIHTWQT